MPGAEVRGQASEITLGRKKVLVVDDDRDILNAIVTTLQKNGYQVFSSLNGNQGFALFQRLAPDLIISDIKMPELDGFELLQKVKNQAPDQRFVLTSGFYPNIDDDLAKSIFKADSLLRKPFSTQSILAHVERALHLEK